MWIASKLGWFSIVEKSPDEFHVRARVKTDLVKLRQASGMVFTIHLWPGADYRYRFVVNGEQLDRIFKALRESIDYSNFKSEIAATPDQRGKLHSYHDIWAIMMRHQAQKDAVNER